MPTPLCQKKIKVELTLSVIMNEVELPGEASAESAQYAFLQKLQQALLSDEAGLSRLVISAVVNQLQGYTDYLAAQDDLSPFMQAAKTLAPEVENFALGPDFAENTRPLRSGCMDVQMISSTIAEEVGAAEGEAQWQPIWRDLRLDTLLGRAFKQLGIPNRPVPYRIQRDSLHHLRVRYATQQQDGIHIEGRCTCQEAFEGAGFDESQAFDNLWSHYKVHQDKSQLASKFQKGWEIRVRPGNQ